MTTPFLEQFRQKSSGGTSLDFVSQGGYRLTSGYRTPVHNAEVGGVRGSYHTRGDKGNPWAVDIDYRGVDKGKLIADAAKHGGVVIDETGKPGQPHYHVQFPSGYDKKGGSTGGKVKGNVSPFLAQFANIPMPDVKAPAINTAVNPKTGTIPLPSRPGSVNAAPLVNAALSSEAPQFNIPSLPVAPLNNVAQRTMDLIDRQPVVPKDPNILQGLGNVANAAGQFIQSVPGQIAGAFQKELTVGQANPLQSGIERYASLVPQAIEGVRNLAQAPADISAAIGNAYMGRQEFAPGYTLPSTRDIPTPFGKTLGQIYDEHPVTGFAVENAIPVESIAGAGLKALRGVGKAAKTAEIATDVAPRFRSQADIIRNLGELEGVVDNQKLTPAEVQALTPPERLSSANPNVLNEAFAQRTRPTDAPQVIDPRNQPLPREIGDFKTEATDSGVQIATRAGQREIPQVEIAKGIQGEDVPLTVPKERSPILDAYGRPEVDIGQRKVHDARTAALLRAEEISKKVDNAESNLYADTTASAIPGPVSREVGSSILDATGKPIARDVANPTIERPGQPVPRDINELEIPRPFERPVAREVGQVEPTAETAKPGAFTDTINELLKNSGLDWAGVQKLKADIDTRRSLLNTTLKNSRTDEAKRLRSELKEMDTRWKALDPNIKEVAGQEFDPQTGMGQQRGIDPNSQFTLDKVRGELDAQSAPIAERINEALQKGVKVRLKYVGEQTGRSNEVAKLSKGGRAVVQTTEFSPTHFGYFNATYPGGPRKVPAVFGYNQRGHEVGYYLNKSPKGSHIQQVVSITDKPAFSGPIANVAKGQGQYSVTDLLSRGSRSERGFVKTSEAIRAIHEQKIALREVANNSNLPADAKQRIEKVFSGKDFGYDDIRQLRKQMSEPGKLAEFCKNMGLA